MVLEDPAPLRQPVIHIIWLPGLMKPLRLPKSTPNWILSSTSVVQSSRRSSGKKKQSTALKGAEMR